jgi:hypothetical protein
MCNRLATGRIPARAGPNRARSRENGGGTGAPVGCLETRGCFRGEATLLAASNSGEHERSRDVN